jgi:hypothetical protein
MLYHGLRILLQDATCTATPWAARGERATRRVVRRRRRRLLAGQIHQDFTRARAPHLPVSVGVPGRARWAPRNTLHTQSLQRAR